MKLNHIIKLLIFVTLLPSVSRAEITKVDYSKRESFVNRAETIDITFTNKTDEQFPFEVEFTADFVSPSGERLSVPGFYKGDKQWVIRFSSNECGAWRYTTKSPNRHLDNRAGVVRVEDRGDRRGAITTSADQPNRFIYEGGDPYFLMGFECDFLFALNYHNEEQTPQLDQFLDRIAADGFNHIVMNVYAHDVVWSKDSKLDEYPQYEFGELMSIYPFAGDNDNPDYTTLNVDFFDRLDRVIEKMGERQIVSHLMIYVWNKDVSWPDTYSHEDNRYFDYVVKRYQAFPNLVWDISKEALFYGRVDDAYIIDRIDRLRALDAFKRQMTVHDFGFCNRHSDILDFISTQDWNLNLYGRMLDIYKKFGDKPIYNIENGGYEQSDFHVFPGNYTTAETCLRRNYESIFAGVYATHYWQGCSWNVIAYDWFNQDPAQHYTPKMEYYQYLTDFFTKYDFSTFRPLPSQNNSGFCMTDDKGIILYYLPKEAYTFQSIGIRNNLEELSYQWFNTTTGEYTQWERVSPDHYWFIPSAPWHTESDAIFILKGKSIKEG
ncbi:MAG: DUF5060 domain-containing protein [Rikenellaceae bacterium]